MRISDWSSDVCSSDLVLQAVADVAVGVVGDLDRAVPVAGEGDEDDRLRVGLDLGDDRLLDLVGEPAAHPADPIADVAGRHVGIGAQQEPDGAAAGDSEEHTSELQSLMRISYAVFCLKKKHKPNHISTCNTSN